MSGVTALRPGTRAVHLHPHELELAARAVAALADELRRANPPDHEAADLFAARAAELLRAA